MARRITAIHAETAVLDTVAPKLRITAIHAEIIVFVTAASTPQSVADTMSMSDGITVGLGLVLTDTLNNWVEAAQTFYDIIVGALTVSVEDSLARTGPGNAQNKDSWKDGLQLNLTPFGDLFIAIDDLETNLADALKLGLGLAVFDNLNVWQDDPKIARSMFVEAFDSMFYNQGDEVAVSSGASRTANDNLNAWLDAVETFSGYIRSAQDSLNFWQDQALTSAVSLPAVGDTLTMTDALSLALSVHLSVADSLFNWADAQAIGAVSVQLTRSVADTLAMSDALATLTGSSNVSYLRRYLNDVVR